MLSNQLLKYIPIYNHIGLLFRLGGFNLALRTNKIVTFAKSVIFLGGRRDHQSHV